MGGSEDNVAARNGVASSGFADPVVILASSLITVCMRGEAVRPYIVTGLTWFQGCPGQRFLSRALGSLFLRRGTLFAAHKYSF